MVDIVPGEGESSQAVLVVDDHELVRNMVVSTLVKEGFTVRSAATGVEAIELVRSDPSIKCLLQDLSMPTMSGGEIIAEVTRIRPDIAVLVCSAHEESAVVHGLSHLGISGYLQKPFDPNTLFAKIRAILND